MNAQSEHPVMTYLRRLDANLAELRADIAEIKHRLRAAEDQIGALAASEQSHYSTVVGRLDRLGPRVERIERRLDSVTA
jgi:chromosome segregation ATPase